MNEVLNWFVQNWPAIEALGRNIAADIAALVVLAKALAEVLKKLPFFSQFGKELDGRIKGLVFPE